MNFSPFYRAGERSAFAVTVLMMAGSVFADEARSIDGTGNNIANPTYGAADTQVIRWGYSSVYPGDGSGTTIVTPPERENARVISNAVNTQVGDIFNNRGLSDWVVQWGQFLAHDMVLIENDAANGTANIPVPAGDPLGPNPIPFNRSNFDAGTGVPGTPRQQVNSITSYIDASNVYGSDPIRAAALRTFSDGLLVTSAGGLLPGLNPGSEDNADPFGLGAALYLAGDVRANEQVGLTATHSLFVREHNRLAGLIQAQDPLMSDEDIYQTARKIVGAEMQAITYNEFLPALLGPTAPSAGDYVHNSSLDASIDNTFATAAFRFGHSMQSPQLALVADNGVQTGTLSLSDAFFDPTFLGNDPSNVELVLKGLAAQTAQENDAALVDDIRNFLFGPPGAGGLDLAALDIQRGRDHGLNDYNASRISFGLPPIFSFADITSDASLQAALLSLYGNVDNLDPWVGITSEDHLAGSSVGALTDAIIVDQFERLRDGDRFFYTDDADLQSVLVTSVIDLNTITLSEIIQLNTGLTSLQENVFFAYEGLVGDLNADGFVGIADINIVLSNWNQNVPFGDPLADPSGDGFVGIEDLDTVLGNWNTGMPPGTTQYSLIPEPGSAVCWLSGLLLIRRRRGE